MKPSVVPRHGPVVSGLQRILMRVWKVFLLLLPIPRIGNHARYWFWRRARYATYYAPEIVCVLSTVVTVTAVVLICRMPPDFMLSWSSRQRTYFIAGGSVYAVILGIKLYSLTVPYINRWSDYCLDREIKYMP